MKKVIVKNNVIPKLKRFFPWVYRNELKKIPKNVKSGELISIFSSDGKFLGIGYINLNSVITVRVLSFNKEKIDIDFFKRRIVKALEKRNNLKNITNGYRIIHSEADFLPGLIVDFYDNYLSIQINTAGMENFRQEILSVLIDLIKPKGIYEKSDKKSREKEGLKTEEKTIYGSIPNEIIIYENNLRFVVDLTDSQKTGFYLDQRKNRMIVSNYSEGKILDLFSNSGGFGIYSYHKGADFVKFVDISPNAIKHLKRNCEINKIKKNYSIVKEDVFDFLKREEEKGEKYDLIIIDPPSFAKTVKEKEGALKGFKYLISRGLNILKDYGHLAIFSCSHSISMEDLKRLSLEIASKNRVYLEIVEHLYQDNRDHPYILNIDNSLYLKGLLLKKIKI